MLSPKLCKLFAHRHLGSKVSDKAKSTAGRIWEPKVSSETGSCIGSFIVVFLERASCSWASLTAPVTMVTVPVDCSVASLDPYSVRLQIFMNAFYIFRGLGLALGLFFLKCPGRGIGKMG